MDIYNVIIMDRWIRHCILLRVFLRSLFWKDFGGQRSWKYMFLFLLRFHCYEYKTHWHIALFCFPEMSALLPRGVWIRNILCYPETRVPLKGSISENACIGPVGAEFRWAWRVSIISSISLFFAHYFHETHTSRARAQRLNVPNVILSVLLWALYRC